MNPQKTVLVTGSSRGIGKAIAAKFAEEGYNIVLNCIKNFDMMHEFEKELKSKGVNCISFGLDVSDYVKCKKMFDGIKTNFGGADIVINNAGILNYGLFNTSAPSEWEYLMKNNFFSVLNCSHLAIPYMLQKREGVIINLSSIYGVAGASCEAVYSASKGAISLFTKSLAKELGPSGIRVNAVAPGAIDTDMIAYFSKEERAAIEDEIPLSRYGQPHEVADMVYAMSQNTYLNGQTILLDGGVY
ncbi:MAG: SDR family NAD(P)-dependent oxidoreductase [Defluviitaleaceae bacterium]|nr:SDR family NAD(P)-dependent oxidoreductase [Defluviitaleaceae bacterium]